VRTGGGLDAGFVVQFQNGHPQVLAAHERAAAHASSRPDPALLRKVQQQGAVCRLRKCGEEPSSDGNWDQAAVAAPILRADGTVWGTVYGLRTLTHENRRRAIRPLEALWLQLIAESLGSGVARLAAKEQLIKSLVLLEQAFTPIAVNQLEQNPELLAARQQEISVLSCDLRDSSRLLAQHPPQVTYRLLSELMDLMTQSLLDHSGVVVDYYGDGLIAMWNAPIVQPDHATRAAHAARDMLLRLQTFGQRWRELFNQELRWGCGIHSGPALVGNAGSQRRPKYGPRGATVHLASRIESATKVVRATILLSQATRDLLPKDVVTQPIATFRLPGHEQPVRLHRLCCVDEHAEVGPLRQWTQAYESALHAYESGQLETAQFQLFSLVQSQYRFPCDAEYLLSRVTQQLEKFPTRRRSDCHATTFDPVIRLVRKEEGSRIKDEGGYLCGKRSAARWAVNATSSL